MYIYTYILYLQMNIYIYMYIFIHMYEYTYTYKYIHILHIHTYTYILIYICVYAYKYVYTCKKCIYTCLRLCMQCLCIVHYVSKDVECWCSYLPVPAVTSSHHWLRGVGPATSSITKAASSWRKRHRQAVTREKRTFVQQPRCKHSWKPQGKKHQLQGIPGRFFWEKLSQLERSN